MRVLRIMTIGCLAGLAGELSLSSVYGAETKATGEACSGQQASVTYQTTETSLSEASQTELMSLAGWLQQHCPGRSIRLLTPIPEHMDTASPEWTRAIQRSTVISRVLIDNGLEGTLIERDFPVGELAEAGEIRIDIMPLADDAGDT